MEIPKFELMASDGKTYTDKNFATGNFVIYAYPKDMTTGCTIQAQDFRDLNKEFAKIDVKILGISTDNLENHQKFCQKEKLNFPLLSDENHKLLEKLGAWQEKINFGKNYFGIIRSTFLLKNGEIIKAWKGVKPKDHARKVLSFWQTYLVE